ncbi:MAG: hypothetical protein WBP93_12950 [Pyrinomonadaceae bacterium]
MLVCLIALSACKQSDVGSNQNSANSNSSNESADISSTPPFSTKEPERYQALMVVTGDMNDQSSQVAGAADFNNQQMFIARDGEKRRVDYGLNQGVKLSYLQLPNGLFLALPDEKIYAEIKLGEENSAPNLPMGEAEDFSPDRLLNESHAGARYEKLGVEDLNGRATTKYRVTTVPAQTGETKGAAVETIVWIDEALGMPVKSETTSTRDGASTGKFTMELRNIKQEVDARLFDLPQDYKKVDAKEIYAHLLPSTGATN